MNRPTIYQHKLDELLLQQFEITESEIKDIVKFPPDEMAIKRNPADENQIVFSGGNIYVHPKDNHMEHIESHKQFYQQFFNTLKADRQEMLEEHILEHNEYAQKQQQFMPQPGMGMPGMPGMGMPEGGGQTTRSMPFTGLPRTINPNELIGQTQ